MRPILVIGIAALAWSDIADVTLEAGGTVPVVGRRTRVTMRSGEVVEGYVEPVSAEHLVLSGNPAAVAVVVAWAYGGF